MPRISIKIAPVLAAFLSVLAAVPGLAQEACEERLSAAQEAYDFGRFEKIPGWVEPCRRAAAGRQQKIRAYSLLARAFLAQDEEAAAREAISFLLRLEPGFKADAPPRFQELIDQERDLQAARRVVAASRISVSRWEAPALVSVVTAEEIERRGYLDLESILHDLPGLDLTRGNGNLYSSLYLRGVRSTVNDGIKLFVDGIEQDDPTSNAVDLSRQYGIANLERVEVVYGPASSIYGADAYAGVINVVTRDPAVELERGKTRWEAIATAGSFETGSLDWDVALHSLADIVFSAGGRFFQSEETDLSSFPDWDYLYDVDYRGLTRLTGGAALKFLEQEPMSPLYEGLKDPEGAPVVELTDLGVDFVSALDQKLLRENGVSFSDRTRDWLIYAKTRISGLTLGVQHWNRSEGVAPWYGERFRLGSEQGSVLAPRQISFLADYARSLARANLRFAARYQQNDVSTRELAVPVSFASGRLGLFDLAAKCLPGLDGQISASCAARIEACPAGPDGEIRPGRCNLEEPGTVIPGSPSTRFTSELSLVYELTENLGAAFSADIRRSSIPLFVDSLYTGRSFYGIGVPLLIKRTDGGISAEVAYRPSRTVRIFAGGRVDRSLLETLLVPDIESDTLFHPRLAVIYTPWSSVVLKAIYAEGFKDPLNTERLSATAGILANPELRPERVQDVQLIAGWQPAGRWRAEAAVFVSRYRDLVEPRPAEICFPSPSECLDRQPGVYYTNEGEGRARGLQLRASLVQGRLSWSGNYTFTEPVRSDPAGGGDLRVADIARHRLNLGVEALLGDRWNADLRMSYVGARRTGLGTTVPTNPLRQTDAYLVADAAVSYRDLLPGTTLQLILTNLSDEQYEHPGVRAAGTRFVASIPQPGRGIFLRFLTRIPASRSRPTVSG
jgi:outer membrane receptor for ferrienterochelin and colicins